MTAPLRRDPTRTTQLRRRFMAAIKRKFVALKRAVLKYFEENPLGLVANVGERFVFATDKAKVEAFDKWLQEQIDAGVLVESEYEGFIDTAYKQGVRRAYEETNKAGGIDKTDDFLQGQKEAFLAEAFNGPVARGRVEMLATRSFEALKGVTATMSTRMNTLLADGITHGRNPRDIARDMARTIDGLTRQRALTIARTEVIHAHAEGQLDSFDKLGVERLDVEIEWVTAGDARVCPKCRAKNGTKYVKTDDARGMIPFHPNCRCMWVPAVSVPTEEELAKLEKAAEGRQKKKKKPAPAPGYPVQPAGDFSPAKAVGGRSAGDFKKQAIDAREREALNEYQAAMYKSKNGGYTTMQKTLREDVKTGTVRNHGTDIDVGPVWEDIKALDSAIAKGAAEKDVVVLRGVKGETFGKSLTELKPGDTYVDAGYSSTTTSSKVGKRFAEGLNAKDEPALLKINVPEGFPALPVDTVGQSIKEAEVLLPRNVKFEVVKVQKGRGGGPATVTVQPVEIMP